MIREIGIKAVANGYVVSVGCQTFVFEKAETLAREIEMYLRNPEEREKHWFATAQNIKHTMGLVEPRPLPAQPTPLRSMAEQQRLRETYFPTDAQAGAGTAAHYDGPNSVR